MNKLLLNKERQLVKALARMVHCWTCELSLEAQVKLARLLYKKALRKRKNFD